jgi:hypothetical protein
VTWLRCKKKRKHSYSNRSIERGGAGRNRKRKEKKVSLLTEENLKNAVAPIIENLQKAQDVLRQGSVADRQELLFEAMGFLGQVWPDEPTARSLGVTFGLKETLCNLPATGSLIVTAHCSQDIQFELKRVATAKPYADPTLCHYCLNPFPPPKWLCCLGYSQP